MEARWLEAFVAVAEELHFGRAAARLHMSQSPLSQVIRRLEDEVGVTLFERSTRYVAMTPSGEALLPHARKILSELRVAANAARGAAGELHGKLRVGFSGAHNHRTLPVLARSVRERLPNIELDFVAGVRTTDGMRHLRTGDLDLCFIGVLGEPPAPLDYRVISLADIGAVVPDYHPLARQSRIEVGQLRDEPFVLAPNDGNSSIVESVHGICRNAGFVPQVKQTISDPFIALTLVAAGVGVSMQGSELRVILPEGCTWLDLSTPSTPFRHGIAWNTDALTPALQAVIDLIDEDLALHDGDRQPTGMSSASALPAM